MELWIRELGTKLKGLWKRKPRVKATLSHRRTARGLPSSGGGVVYTTWLREHCLQTQRLPTPDRSRSGCRK